MNEEPIPRPASRVILIDANDRVLLMLVTLNGGPPLWITPGGGLEPGETYEEGALRELWEELGLRDVTLGPCIWLRKHVFHFRGQLYEQQERYFIFRTDGIFEIDTANMEELELQSLHECRWWTVDEIESSEDTFVPRDLAALLRPVLEGKLPCKPLEVPI